MNFRTTSTIHWLMLLSVITTIITGFLVQRGVSAYSFGMHGIFLEQGLYLFAVFQTLVFEFIHGGVLHLASNMIFLVLIGLPLEWKKGSKWMLRFFLCIHLALAIALSFGSVPTVGISGFAMAVLAYYMFQLRSFGNDEWKSVLVLLVLNIAIGLDPGISLWGHLWGAVFGGIYYGMERIFFKK